MFFAEMQHLFDFLRPISLKKMLRKNGKALEISAFLCYHLIL